MRWPLEFMGRGMKDENVTPRRMGDAFPLIFGTDITQALRSMGGCVCFLFCWFTLLFAWNFRRFYGKNNDTRTCNLLEQPKSLLCSMQIDMIKLDLVMYPGVYYGRCPIQRDEKKRGRKKERNAIWGNFCLPGIK